LTFILKKYDRTKSQKGDSQAYLNKINRLATMDIYKFSFFDQI